MAKNISESLRALLMNDATVFAAVSGRIYPNQAPKNPTYPFVVYDLNSEVTLDTFNPPSNTLRTANMTFACYYKESPTGTDARTSARTLADAVADAIQTFIGTVSGGVTIAGTDTCTFSTGFFEDEGGDFREISHACTLNVWYRE